MTIRTEALTKQFGGLTAVDRVSLEVDDEIVGLMGPNGSGKSTFVNCITGVFDPTSGEVYHREEEITGAKMYEIARRGIARTFQTPHIFGSLTVHENVTVPLVPPRYSVPSSIPVIVMSSRWDPSRWVM